METGAFLHIGKATRSDLDAIMKIEVLCFDSEAFSRRQMSYLITKAKGFFYVVRYQEKVVAYLSLTTNSYTRYARIYSIAVHPDTRGRHFGQLLIEKAVEYATKNDCRHISLEVKTGNTAAIRLYEKNGFITTGIRPCYYPDGSGAYYMVRAL